MLTKTQYLFSYPSIASFASDPSSSTYTRKSKTGKTFVVRKGKRKKLTNIGIQATGAVGAAAIANAGVTKYLKYELKKPNYAGATKVGLRDEITMNAVSRPKKMLALGAAGTAAVIGAGYLGYRVAKKFTDKD